MNALVDIDQWRHQLEASFSRMTNDVAEYLPLIIGALVILLVGWLVARLAGATVSWVLKRAGFDRGVSRMNLTETLQRAGISTPPSRILGRTTYWVLLLVFARAALDVLSLAAVSAAIERLLAYLPNLASAALIVLLGFLFARLARNFVVSAAATMRLTQTDQIGGFTHALVVLVTAIVALERLGVETQLFVTLLTALVAAFGFTMGLAFALGARPLVTHILAGHFLRQRLPQSATVEVQGRRGVVERVGSVDTVFKDGDREWSIPNSQLIDEIVAR